MNKAAIPLKRGMTPPVVATEAVGKMPLSESQSDNLYEMVRRQIDSPYASRPAVKRQGAWKGDEGMQFNPLYEQELPRRMGAISEDEEALKYAAMLGEGLDQQGVPLMRSMGLPFDIADDADALVTEPMHPGTLRALAEQLGDDVVVSQQPGGGALIFGLGDRPLHDIRDQVERGFPNLKPRFGVSRPGMDRLVVTEQDWGAPNRTRESILGR